MSEIKEQNVFKECEKQSGSLDITQSSTNQNSIAYKDKHECSDTCDKVNEKQEYGTQRVYKKTSPNCVLTLYLPTRELIISGNSPSILRGIVYVDPQAIQGYRIYAQLTLTFRYGREDEEVMGLRFCNEAIMSLHQVWPSSERLLTDSLTPLQEALIKRLGNAAYPFTLTLSPQAPPSVQLVPAKRYYGAPIGTSYDVRCFLADKRDEKFHRRASVKMGVRVIYRTDVIYQNQDSGLANFATFINNAPSSPPATSNTKTALATTELSQVGNSGSKQRKSERGDSFPRIRLSPKSFRFSGRFGRSKSEIEKYPNDTFFHYSKSFQEYETVSNIGPYGVVEKPFLLQDGRVSLRANLNKPWYTHGEDIRVTINIRNESRKTVRKIRVCAIQHVDVCMFNNGKFKNVVADSDTDCNSPTDRTVSPGDTLNTTIILKPQRGQTKNWIALEDTLQRSTEPEEINGVIAVSAVRSLNMIMNSHQLNNKKTDSSIYDHQNVIECSTHKQSISEDRNVFAIYVSYYIKVKLVLSSMGGEVSLKLPFVLVHINDPTPQIENLTLNDVHLNRRENERIKHQNTNVELQYFSEDSTIDPLSLFLDSSKKKDVDKKKVMKTDEILLPKVPSEKCYTAEKVCKENTLEQSDFGVEYVHVVQIHQSEAEECVDNADMQ